MKVTPDHIKDYVFGELNAADRREVEAAIAADPTLREELSRLQLTQTFLAAMPEEEMPRRIAFVSDKVFEPKWWQVWLNSGPRMAFASACLLAMAILTHGAMQPVPVAAPVVATAPAPSMDAKEFEARVAAEVARALPAALEQAEARHRTRLASVVKEAETKYRQLRQEDMQIMEANYRLWREKEAKKRVDYALLQSGGVQ